MTNDQRIWVDEVCWRENWDEVQRLQGGGQGYAWRVSRKRDGREGFLKVIRAKWDPERRARFSREANAYSTVNTSGIPHLIESNAHRWEVPEVEPYIVTDFIDGPTLRKWRESQERVELDKALDVTRELLTILSECHDAGLVHRDVKPDNIIFADSDPGRLVLLDFGLSFRKGSEINFETVHGQEIGNRFLRLQELSGGSPLKQDVRSDLSFAAGILFYLLTEEPPYILQDAKGRLPHQRDEALSKLQELAGARLPRLGALFDNAFEPLIENRFSSASAMLASIERVMESREDAHSEESLLHDIREAMDTLAARRQEATHVRLTKAHEHIFRVFEDVKKFVQKSTGISLDTVRHGFSGVRDTKRTLSWRRPGSEETVLSVTFDVREAGDEVVIQLSGAPVYRTSVVNPRYGDRFDETIRDRLLALLHEAVANPG